MANLIKFDPFAEFNALQRQFFGDDWMTPLKGLTLPTTDVYTRDGKELVVEAHLPNFDQKDVSIQVDKDVLIIQAEKHEKEEDKEKKYVVRESASSFYRRIALPERADAEGIDAHLEDGVLKVKVPLKALPEPKKIEIGTGKKSKKLPDDDVKATK
ncbi:MAG TPA: Hsp20/alpha crystallin family protein [Candidatus Saccharimonadales bacterium]|nr:Hsp20/alpha crystallin family protein [Candidatus Saccharimonadales bacterium]